MTAAALAAETHLDHLAASVVDTVLDTVSDTVFDSPLAAPSRCRVAPESTTSTIRRGAPRMGAPYRRRDRKRSDEG